MAAGARIERHGEPASAAAGAAGVSNSSSDRCGLPIATASMRSARSAVDKRRLRIEHHLGGDDDPLARRHAVQRRRFIRRFGRRAGDMKQADRSRRRRGRAERLQDVFPRAKREAGDHADRIADQSAVQVAEHRPGDVGMQERLIDVRHVEHDGGAAILGRDASRSRARGRKSRTRCRENRRSDWCARRARNCRTPPRSIRPTRPGCRAAGRWPAWYGAQVHVGSHPSCW